MKRGLSTGKPTKEEAARIVASKEGPCMACLVRFNRTPGMVLTHGNNDYHHTLSGGRRRGHAHGFALCPWHHRRLAEYGTHEEMTEAYGPSLMDGSKIFREYYGTDQELIDLQTITIEGGF